jgi:hypothetical protein
VSARELAMGFVHHVRRIDEIAYGSGTYPMRTRVPSRGEILLALESAFLGAHAALASLPPSRWAEIVPAPAGFTPVRHGRRGELLWLALRELIRHDRHFALHLSSASHGDGRGAVAAVPAPEAAGELAVGA